MIADDDIADCDDGTTYNDCDIGGYGVDYGDYADDFDALGYYAGGDMDDE